MEKIRTGIVGAGKMGSIHARVYNDLSISDLAGVVDINKQAAENLAGKYNCRFFTDYRDLIGRVDAVTIAAPTVHHLELAKVFIENGIAVMIEKPIAAGVSQGRQIVALAKKHNVVAAVGHSERCNPVVQAMKRLAIEPKFIEANRISPYSFRSTDIGVVLDVMIHDIDIILSLASSEIVRIDAVGVNVIADHEDICNARIVFANGCIANITASRVAMKTERKVRVFSRQAYLSLDYYKKEGVVIQVEPNVDVVKWIRRRQQEDFDFSDVDWAELLHIEQLDIDDKEPLRVEQEAFLGAVADSKLRPEVTAEEGLAALECAEKILEAVKKHKWD
ncbi:MAG: Gfo/Idh/MocA family oxidoreductase [Planctomycetota bacterium]